MDGVLSTELAELLSLKSFRRRLFILTSGIIPPFAFHTSQSNQLAHEKDPQFTSQCH